MGPLGYTGRAGSARLSFPMHFLEQLIAHYGVLVVLFGAAVGGETLVLLGGFLAHQGVIDVRAVAIAAFVGSFAADQAWFWAARHFSTSPFIERQRKRSVFAAALRQVEAHPIAFILGFRFVYGFRTISPMAIGISQVPSRQFLVLNLIAAAVWAVAITAIGWVFGQTAELFLGRLGGVERKLIVGILFAGAVSAIIYLIARHFVPRPPRDAQGRSSGAASDGT